jgi:hypothetical protein
MLTADPALIAPIPRVRAIKTESLQRWWQGHGYILPSFFISLLICAWFVTWGDWKFLEPEEFCGFYDAQARSMIDGRLDVPRAAIGLEAFTFEGKTYGYFGIAPALLRLPLVLASKTMDGRWSRLLMMIACTINLLCAWRILRLLLGRRELHSWWQRALHSLFILCAGVGSTNVFLVARSFTFHEAIMWGATFALLFTCALLKYFAQPRLGSLAWVGVFAFMSIHSRATAGAGTFLALVVVATILICRALVRPGIGWSALAFGREARSWRHALVAAAAVIAIGLSYLGVNYAKFRTFNGVPLQYYDCYAENSGSLRQTGGRQIHLENIPTTAATYFGVRGLWLDPRFPWVFPSRDATFVGSPAIVLVEGFSTFPISMPALLLLAVSSCLPFGRGSNETVRRLRLPALSLLLGGGIVLATVALTERYLHDFYPAMIICAAVGVWRIEQEKHFRSAIILIAALSFVSVAINCAFALENQRLDSWGVGGVPPAKKAEFKQVQKSVYRFFNR